MREINVKNTSDFYVALGEQEPYENIWAQLENDPEAIINDTGMHKEISLTDCSLASVLGSCEIISYDDSKISLRDASLCKTYGEDTITAEDQSTVISFGGVGSKIIANGKSHVISVRFSTVYAHDNSVIFAHDSSIVIADGNSTVFGRSLKNIHLSGEASFVKIGKCVEDDEHTAL